MGQENYFGCHLKISARFWINQIVDKCVDTVGDKLKYSRPILKSKDVGDENSKKFPKNKAS